MQPADVSREVELQRLLSDERSRCDQYKQIYQTLKEQHQRLQDELTIIHQQLKEANERHIADKTKNESYKRKLEETVKQKQHEIDKLTEKISSCNPETIRNEITLKTSEEYQSTVNKLLDEADENRKLYCELQSTYTLLKCKFEFSETEYISAIESLKSEHRYEVAELNSKIKDLNSTKLPPKKDYSEELKDAEKEVRQLQLKLKAVQSECEELSIQNEKASLQYDSSSQNLSKQVTEHAATIKSFEAEKNSLFAQKEVLTNRLQKCEDDKKDISNKFQIARHEGISLKAELDRLTQNLNLNVVTSKKELEKLKTEHKNKEMLLERELSLKKDQIQQLQEDHARLMAEQQSSFTQHMTILKQQMWKESHEVQQRMENMRRHIAEIEASKKKEIEQYEQKLEHARKETEEALHYKSSMEKELLTLKSEVSDKSKESSQAFENLVKQNSKFRDEIEDLKTGIAQRSAGMEFLEGGRRMPTNNTDHQTVAELQLSLARQKFEFQQRIDNLESSFKEQRDALINEKKAILTKQKQYAKLIHKLREKLNTEKLHLEEIEVQNELLKNNIPVEDHLQLKTKFSELQTKQEEFHQVMLAASHFIPLGNEVWKSSDFWSSEKKYLSPVSLLASANSLQLPTSIPTKSISHQRTIKNSFKPHRRKSSLRRTSKTHQAILNSSSSDIENL